MNTTNLQFSRLNGKPEESKTLREVLELELRDSRIAVEKIYKELVEHPSRKEEPAKDVEDCETIKGERGASSPPSSAP